MNIEQIRQIIKLYDVYPAKSKGQNFLIDENVLKQIVAAADLQPADLVLEIGPGLGVLTRELVKRVKKVLAVELDSKLIIFLQANLAEINNLELLPADILKIKNQEISDRLSGEYKVVANIPYNITAPVIRKFLSYDPKPQSLTLLVQKEVAERICAKPGEMSILAVSAQFYAEPEIMGYVSKQAFWPVPKVESAILKLTVTSYQLSVDEDLFFRLVKIGFSARRKKLYNNLSAGLKLPVAEVKKALADSVLDVDCRAQDLGVTDWIKLSEKI